MSCSCDTPLNCAVFGCLSDLRRAQRLPRTGPLPSYPEPPLLSEEEVEGQTRAAAWLPAVMAVCDRLFAQEPDLEWEMYCSVYKRDRDVGRTLFIPLHPANDVARLLIEGGAVIPPWGPGNAYIRSDSLLADDGLRSVYGGLATQMAGHLYNLLDFLGTRQNPSAITTSTLLRRAIPSSGVPQHLVPGLGQKPGRATGDLLAILHFNRSGMPKPSPDVTLAAALAGQMLDPRAGSCDSDGVPGRVSSHPQLAAAQTCDVDEHEDEIPTRGM